MAKPKGFKCTGGIMAEEAVALFRCFYEQGNPNGLCFCMYLFIMLSRIIVVHRLLMQFLI